MIDLQQIHPKRILIINIFGIGDVLFTTPLITNLKACFPDVKIGYVVNKRAQTVIANDPAIDQIFVYERDDFKKLAQESRRKYLKAFFIFLKSIRQERYDVVFDVSLNSFTALMTWLLGIQHRIGFNYKNRSWYLNNKVNLEGYERKHVIQYCLDLLQLVHVPVKTEHMRCFVDEADSVWAQHLFEMQKIDHTRPVIGLVPGGGASWGRDVAYRRWPIEKYVKLADNLIEKFSAQIILLGDQSEVPLCEAIMKGKEADILSECGQTTIGQFSALVQRCSLVIANDGGPLHISVAVGAKTVSIFGPVDDQVYGPYPRQGHEVVVKDIACRPCYRRFRRAMCDHISCLQEITVDDVLRKVDVLV